MTDETQQNTQNFPGQNLPESKPKRHRATQEEMLERKRKELDKLKNNTQKLGKEIEQLEKKVNEHNRKKENNIKYMMAGYLQKRYEEMHNGEKLFDLTYYKDTKRVEERTEEWLQELQNETKSSVSINDEQTIKEAHMYQVLCQLIGFNITKNTTVASLETRLHKLTPGTIQSNWDNLKKR